MSQKHDTKVEVPNGAEIMATLINDVIVLADDRRHSPDKYRKEMRTRCLVRAVFAMMEGLCDLLRSQAFIGEANKIPKQADIGRLSVLGGQTYMVTTDGEIKGQELRIRFLDGVLLYLNAYAEALGVNYRVKKGDDWHRIKAAVEVRHKLTHPKEVKALSISERELKDVEFAMHWFLCHMAEILTKKGYSLPFNLKDIPIAE